MLMGIHMLLELRHYWSSELLICVTAVPNLITKTMFDLQKTFIAMTMQMQCQGVKLATNVFTHCCQ
jgi:hypothetical protein